MAAAAAPGKKKKKKGEEDVQEVYLNDFICNEERLRSKIRVSCDPISRRRMSERFQSLRWTCLDNLP